MNLIKQSRIIAEMIDDKIVRFWGEQTLMNKILVIITIILIIILGVSILLR